MSEKSDVRSPPSGILKPSGPPPIAGLPYPANPPGPPGKPVGNPPLGNPPLENPGPLGRPGVGTGLLPATIVCVTFGGALLGLRGPDG